MAYPWKDFIEKLEKYIYVIKDKMYVCILIYNNARFIATLYLTLTPIPIQTDHLITE